MARPIGPRFSVTGVEPAEVRACAPAVRKAFWTAALAFVLEAKERELAAGLDRRGLPMAPLAASTIRNRRSAMGPPDPGAPALQPAHALSRTRSLLTGRATPSGVVCWWLFDPLTGASWGEMLARHRAGGANLPKRDVIGLSPKSRAEVAARGKAWWVAYKAANATTPGGKKTRHYTLQSGTAAQIDEARATGTFSGFRTADQVRAERTAYGHTYKADGSVDWSAFFRRNPPGGSLPPVASTPPPKPIASKPPSPPVEPPPVASPGPRGVPVGAAITLDDKMPARLRANIEAAIRTVDTVHGDGRLSNLPVTEESKSRRTLGGFYFVKYGPATAIKVADKAGESRLTAVHEIGHFIDYKGIEASGELDENGWRIYDKDPLFAAWLKALKRSAAYKINSKLRKGGRTISKADAEYYTETFEYWARSYAQYVALRSDDAELKAELAAEQRKAMAMKLQWSDDDFAPIAAAIDALFEKLGWRL